MDYTIQYRAEQTLANFNLTDEELDAVIREWTDKDITDIPEGCSPDFPIVLLEKIAHKHLKKRLGLWEEFRAYRITYPLPKEE